MANVLRPLAISIAGFDPSAGAGALADIKTFESLEVNAFSVCSAITYQNESRFIGLDWLSAQQIEQQLLALEQSPAPSVIKIGLVENLQVLSQLLDLMSTWWPNSFIVWDPVIKASAGFEFHQEFSKDELFEVLEKVSLITPNRDELEFLGGGVSASAGITDLASRCAVLVTAVLEGNELKDVLLLEGKRLEFEREYISGFEKHGSGCVFSSAIAAYVAKDFSLEESVKAAGEYTANFLRSNPSLLGYHNFSGKEA